MVEIVIIGAGIAGFAAALACWERGAAVTLVEAHRPGAGATGASAGMLVAQYEAGSADALFGLCLENRRRYPDWAARLEDLAGRSLDVRWDGMLVANLSVAEHEEAKQTAAWQRGAGLQAAVLDPAEAAGIEPNVSSEVVSYLWLSQEGQLDSQRLAEVLGDALRRTAIRLVVGNAALEILSQSGRVVGVGLADGRALEAEGVVLAAGAWSGALRGLPRELPVRPVRGQMLRFSAGAPALRPIVASHAGRYLVPRADGSVLAGSTMEDVGFDRSIDEAGLQAIHGSVSRLVPGLADYRPIEHWAGLRPISADRQPIIGPEPELNGLFYATGYGRDGILLSPLAGAIVADLATTGVSEIDWKPFRPDRPWHDAG
jgi:glycine oxidase